MATSIQYKSDGGVILGDTAENEIVVGADELRAVISDLNLYLSRGKVPYWDEVAAIEQLREALARYLDSDESASAGKMLASAVDAYTWHE